MADISHLASTMEVDLYTYWTINSYNIVIDSLISRCYILTSSLSTSLLPLYLPGGAVCGGGSCDLHTVFGCWLYYSPVWYRDLIVSGPMERVQLASPPIPPATITRHGLRSLGLKRGTHSSNSLKHKLAGYSTHQWLTFCPPV